MIHIVLVLLLTFTASSLPAVDTHGVTLHPTKKPSPMNSGLRKRGIFRDIGNGIKEAVHAVPNLLNGLDDGIEEIVGGLVDTVSRPVDTVRNLAFAVQRPEELLASVKADMGCKGSKTRCLGTGLIIAAAAVAAPVVFVAGGATAVAGAGVAAIGLTGALAVNTISNLNRVAKPLRDEANAQKELAQQRERDRVANNLKPQPKETDDSLVVGEQSAATDKLDIEDS